MTNATGTRAREVLSSCEPAENFEEVGHREAARGGRGWCSSVETPTSGACAPRGSSPSSRSVVGRGMVLSSRKETRRPRGALEALQRESGAVPPEPVEQRNTSVPVLTTSSPSGTCFATTLPRLPVAQGCNEDACRSVDCLETAGGRAGASERTRPFSDCVFRPKRGRATPGDSTSKPKHERHHSLALCCRELCARVISSGESHPSRR